MRIGSGISAVISGGASGLGAAVVTRLSLMGVKVTFFDTNVELGNKLAQSTGSFFVEVEISNHGSVLQGLKSARSKFGCERICINCAGISKAEKTVSKGEAHRSSIFEKVVSVNLNGVFNLSTLSAEGMTNLPLLEESGDRGIIISTTSIAASEGQIGQLAYAASKAGVSGMVLPMARDLAEYGIRVMGIAPGIFSTPMVSGLSQKVQAKLNASIPFPSRLGEPKEFADLVVHIIENSMLNGEVIRLDGAVRLSPT